MYLSDDLHFIVEEDGERSNRHGVTATDFSQCIEVVSDTRERSAEIKTVDVADDELEAWLDIACTTRQDSSDQGKSRRATGVRTTHLLILPIYGPCEYRTPFANEAFRDGVNLVKIQQDASRLLSKGPIRYYQVPSLNGGKGLAIRMDGYNESYISTASMIASNADCTQTCAVIRVLETRNVKHLIRRCTELKQYIWHPCILASLQIDERLPKIKNQLKKLRENIEQMEKTAGVYKTYRIDPNHHREKGMLQPWNSEGFDMLTSSLTSVKNDLLYQRYKCAQFLGLLGFLDDLARKMGDVSSSEYWIKSDFMRNTIIGYEERARYLSDRAETTMQSCFSLMSQRDNYLNQQSADLARKDNAYMKDVASASLRDSRDMRVITLITLCFLPATFVATFFSTSFFDFNRNEQMASAWLWIYWVVTVMLTAVVMGGWYLVSRKPLPVGGVDDKFKAES